MANKSANDALHGMIAPAVTPFENDEVRWDLFERDIAYLGTAGVDGIGVSGSTGEGAVLSDAEIEKAVTVAKRATNNRLPVVAGIRRNSTSEALRAAQRAQAAGASALLVTPVFYSGGTPADNERYYSEIAAATDVPVIVYNVVPTNLISAGLMLRLASIKGVAGIKQVGAEGLAEMVAVCGDATRVFSAADSMLYSTYVAGSVGAISALVTVAPVLCVKQWRAFKEGDQATASEIQRKLSPIAMAYAERPFTSKVKAFIALQGRDVGECRSPLLSISEEQRAQFQILLERAGLLQGQEAAAS